MTDILNRILATKRDEVAAAQKQQPLATLRTMAADAEPARPFTAALQNAIANGGTGLIAEIKKASPSKGLIRPDFNPTELAIAYQNAGVQCLSVLTDELYFQGHEGYLKQARTAVDLPVLRKDFIIDAYQIYQSRAWGADAILLIAAALDASQLIEFEHIAHELGMAVLLELHDEAEAEKCHALTTPLRGVNNRNLRTFEVDLQQTLRLLPQLTGHTVITESGIRNREDVQFMRQHGVHGFLIGETFMRADDVTACVRETFS